jgi:restriction system protein
MDISLNIPSYHVFFLPVLKQLSNGNTLENKELEKRVIDEFGFSNEQINRILNNGRSVIVDRIQWAATYLKKAGLIYRPQRRFLCITESGKMLIQKKPNSITLEILKSYPAFIDFYTRSKGISEPDSSKVILGDEAEDIDFQGETRTPEEQLSNIYEGINANLKIEILEAILQQDFRFFEKLVVKLLVAMGYGGSFKEAAKIIGRSGDEGIDGVIKEDKLGFNSIYVQAKRYSRDNSVSREQIQNFVGALSGQRASKGVFITTSRFTSGARDYQPTNYTVIRIDGEQLAEYMIEYNIGVSLKERYEIKQIDSDFFEE